MKEERCCGNCCWMFAEDTDGDGCCAKHYLDFTPNCSDDVCDDYISRKEMRHHLAVLLQANRFRRDTSVQMIRKIPNPRQELEADVFAADYIKTFSKL